MSLQQTAKATVAAQQQKFLHCLEKFRDKGAHRLETFLSTLSGEQLEEMVVDFLEDHWRDLKPVKSREIREPWLVSGDVRSDPAQNGLSSCHAIIGCSFSQWFMIIYRTVQRQNHLTAISKVMNKSEMQNWGAYGSGQTGLLGRVASPSWLSAGSYQHSWWWWGLGLNSDREETMVLSIWLLPRMQSESQPSWPNALSCHLLSSIQSHSASCAGVLMSRGPFLGPVRKSWKHYGNICSMFTRWSWNIGTQSNRNCKKQGGLAARIGFCFFFLWHCWQRIGS